MLTNAEIKTVKEGIFRIRMPVNGRFKESLLSRYNILKEPVESKADSEKYRFEFNDASGGITFWGRKNKVTLILEEKDGEGFILTIPLEFDERLFGLGDVDRTSVKKRGKKVELWIKNVISYGPMPFVLSSTGWGILINSTYKLKIDLDSLKSGTATISADKGSFDAYVFLADSMKKVIGLYTDISGKPVILPRSAYGFTFVCNEEDGARELLTDCLNFRREDIPCDIMGLEPGWMDKNYDFTTEKKWSPDRFYIPTWCPENYSGTWSFFYNMRQMGFKLSLWLCCDYDLLWEEEKAQIDCCTNSYEGAEIIDKHFGHGTIIDKLLKPGEPWFEHLKKFIDQGVVAFKLDGANQVLEHPDRLWACKYFDDEVHNVYPVILAKQMKEGFRDYKKKRSLIYTVAAYAGTQQYAATWAGDTGGGQATLVSILNYAMCGHTNTSCDLDPTDPSSIHYSFLLPWTQLLGWRNWHHPWLLGEKLEVMIRDYSKLRSSLFPYIYSFAHCAAKTGIPLVRPLPLVYEETDEFDDATNMYMLGDSLLVGAFDMNLKLPPGIWIDYFTRKKYSGTIDYITPPGKGGALLVKEGSIIVTQREMKYLDEKIPNTYYLRIYPGNDCAFVLVEDDGESYDYLLGGVATTEIEIKSINEMCFSLIIHKRKGEFMSMAEVCDFETEIYCENPPKSITYNGKDINFAFDNNAKFVIPKELHKEMTLEYIVNF
jgi:Alpha-glucosidases, family 31 of glycosyl hydrolases